MQTKKAMILTAISVFAILLSINLAMAKSATVASLWTTDTSDNPKVEFGVGETVRIHWNAAGNVDIVARFQDASGDGSWTNQPSSGTIDWTPSKGTGYYSLTCTGYNSIYMIAYGTIFVIPEIPLGTIMATVAGFGAVAMIGTIKIRRSRTK